MIELGIGLALLAGLVLLFIATYKVVDPNEAHVVVIMGSGRRFYGPGADQKSAYFYIPVIMKRYVLPLTNVKMEISDIDLNDMEVAPFMCDVASWVRISDPKLAAERLDLNQPFMSLRADMVEVVQAIARAASMKQEIIDIMRDRKGFAEEVKKEVSPILKEWGVSLVGLEINTIRDAHESKVIRDYEAKRQAQIDSESRIAIADRNREAVESEQDNKRKEQEATAQSEKLSEQAFVEKERIVGIAKEMQEKDIADAEKNANIAKVEAIRKLDVGKAEVKKETDIQIATGQGEAVRILGEKDANVITLTGKAEADAIKAKGEATAVAQEKLALAQQKFNDASTNIEKIKAFVDIQKAMAEAYGKVAENADLKIVSGGDGGDIFGIPLNATTGAGLGQLLEGLDTEALSEAVDAVTKKSKNSVTTETP